jgi:cell division protein FtsQ
VATQGGNRTRSLVWEDDAPAESRFRRVQQSVPGPGRGLPGMPLEADDADGDEPPGKRRARFAAPPRPWWRPAGTWGRIFLAFIGFLVVSAAAYAFNVCKSFLEHDPRFRIAGTSNIQATGLAEVSRGDMLPVFGEDIGRNVFFVPLSERRKQLEQIPWVEHATVMRLLPDQIRVSLVERQPVAFVRHAQQIGLVDGNGVLLSMPVAAMAQHHYSFPVLTGIDGGDPLPSRRARVALYRRLLGELDSNGQHLSEQVSEIDLTDPEDARLLMPEQGTDILAHFGEDHFLDRYQRYKAHIAEWRQQYPHLAAVDLRYDQQVVLEMKPGTSNEQTAVDADSGKPAAVPPAAASAQAETSKPDPAKHVASTKPVTTTHTSSSAAAKARAEKLKQKKRAEAKRAALNHQKPKPPAKTHAATAGQGQ